MHYYCCLFANGLFDNGQKEDGILGFLVEDILKVRDGAKRLNCIYCAENGATSICCVGHCSAVFHYSCGVRNKILPLFDEFR